MDDQHTPTSSPKKREPTELVAIEKLEQAEVRVVINEQFAGEIALCQTVDTGHGDIQEWRVSIHSWMVPDLVRALHVARKEAEL